MFAWGPVDFELSLFGAILCEPVLETHVDGFGLFLYDGAINNAHGSAVIGLNWCCWLCVAEFNEGGGAKGNNFLLPGH